jgi:hypothetical protein
MLCINWSAANLWAILRIFTECYATLRVFIEKVCIKNRQKKFQKKKFRKKNVENFP